MPWEKPYASRLLCSVYMPAYCYWRPNGNGSLLHAYHRIIGLAYSHAVSSWPPVPTKAYVLGNGTTRVLKPHLWIYSSFVQMLDFVSPNVIQSWISKCKIYIVNVTQNKWDVVAQNGPNGME